MRKGWVRTIISTIVLSIAVIVALACVGARNNEIKSDKADVQSPFGEEVLPGVFDDHTGNLYIEVSEGTISRDKSVADIMGKKRGWERERPSLEVVTMTTIMDGSGYEQQYVAGLLIHYKTVVR